MPCVEDAYSTWAEWEAKLEARQKLLEKLEHKKNKRGITFIEWMKISKMYGTKNQIIIDTAAEAWDSGDDPKDYIEALPKEFVFGKH